MSQWRTLQAQWAGRWMRFVPADSDEPLPPPRYVVVLISDEAGRYLLANIQARGYCAPSGHIEPGESPEAAARREAYEETGAVLAQLHILGAYVLSPCSPDEPEPCSAPVYLARAERIDPLGAESESRGIQWATLEELPALYYDWSPLLEAVFAYAEQRRRALREW
ncbi:MAG: NUDIX hydrolase [Fimbriimonadales bacterium]|nr:NUDIX hydrolase [Fimbriimonadales bacterium]MDW8051107.1 NUDIX hydrolase [Armatimonadota bacterium]